VRVVHSSQADFDKFFWTFSFNQSRAPHSSLAIILQSDASNSPRARSVAFVSCWVARARICAELALARLVSLVCARRAYLGLSSKSVTLDQLLIIHNLLVINIEHSINKLPSSSQEARIGRSEQFGKLFSFCLIIARSVSRLLPTQSTLYPWALSWLQLFASQFSSIASLQNR